MHTENADIELQALPTDLLYNSTLKSLSWESLTVTAKDRETKAPIDLVANVSGYARAGQWVVLFIGQADVGR